jgi:hemolysin activation/secretion protein
MMAPIGGSYRMRGYYEGRYRDDNMITTQVELRQRIWRRIGAVAWVGAGNVWGQGSDFSWSHTLPNYGVGLRWEFKKRVNVRLDYGFGKMPTTSDPAIKAKRSSAFIFGINEAF